MSLTIQATAPSAQQAAPVQTNANSHSSGDQQISRIFMAATTMIELQKLKRDSDLTNLSNQVDALNSQVDAFNSRPSENRTSLCEFLKGGCRRFAAAITAATEDNPSTPAEQRARVRE